MSTDIDNFNQLILTISILIISFAFMCYNDVQFVYLQIEKGEEFMFHYFLQLNFATILISSFMLIFVNVNPVFQ